MVINLFRLVFYIKLTINIMKKNILIIIRMQLIHSLLNLIRIIRITSLFDRRMF